MGYQNCFHERGTPVSKLVLMSHARVCIDTMERWWQISVLSVAVATEHFRWVGPVTCPQHLSISDERWGGRQDFECKQIGMEASFSATSLGEGALFSECVF